MLEKNIKYFRLQRGLTQEALGKKIGITKMAISQYEKGTRNPSYEVIQKICKALDVPLGTFMSYTEGKHSIEAVAYRSGDKLSKTQKDNLDKLLRWTGNRFFELVEALGGESQCFPVYHPLPEYNSTNKNPDYIAEQLRIALGLPAQGPIGNLTAWLENRGFLVFYLETDIDFKGCHGKLNGREVIGVKNSLSAAVKRMTVAYELVHIFIDKQLPNQREFVVENICGRFLFPAEDVKREFGGQKRSFLMQYEIESVQQEYGISIGGIMCRASQEKVITRRFEKEEVNKYEAAAKNQVAEETPAAFKKLACIAYAEGIFGISKIAELLNCSYAQAADLCR